MNKILATALLFVLSVCMATAQHFNTYDVDYDVKKYKDIIERNRNHTSLELANDLLRNFPLTQNGAIKFQYVLRADTLFDMDEMREIVENWQRTELGVAPQLRKDGNTFYTDKVMKEMERIPGGMFGFSTVISAEITCLVELREGRMRITVQIPRYRLGFSSVDELEDELIRPGDCYPAKDKGREKVAYAKAFTNSITWALNTCHSLSTMLKVRSEQPQQSKPAEDW